MAASYTVGVDWNNDGDYSDTGESVGARTLETVSVSIGRDQARAFSPPKSGTMSVTLNNRSRDYSPENSSSPLGVANLKPGRPVKLEATLASTTYGLYRGFTDEYEVQPGRAERSVQFSCTDALARFQDAAISTTLLMGARTGDAVGAVLDAVGWDGGRDLDPGVTYMRFWWAEEDAFTALKKILASEGSPALVYVDPSTGDFVFRDRHHRLINAASTTSQVTFRDTGAEPKFSEPLTYQAGWRDVINDVTLQVEEREPAGDLASVWSSQDTITLSGSEATELHVQGSDPFIGAVAPEQDTDYVLLSGAVTSISLSRDNGQSTIIRITADSAGAVIAGMQVRAYPIAVVSTRKVTARDADSIADYGSRGMPDEMQPVWANRYDAQAIADLAVQQRAQRLPIVTLAMKGSANSTRLTQCLTRALSDRITVVASELGLNGDFYVEQISHEINASQGGRWHTTTFGLEKAPQGQAANVLTFGVAGKGFNDGVFGTGIDDPSTLFLFDGGSGHRFDEGLFSR